MLMTIDFVPDDGIADDAKVSKLLQEILKFGETNSDDFGGTVGSSTTRRN